MKHFPYIKQNSIAEIVSTMESFLVAEMGFDSRARRPAVIRGSDSPPDCHSLPLLLRIPQRIRIKLAEMVGFEPTERVTVQTISSRSRYDHFDTSPYKLL